MPDRVQYPVVWLVLQETINCQASHRQYKTGQIKYKKCSRRRIQFSFWYAHFDLFEFWNRNKFQTEQAINRKRTQVATVTLMAMHRNTMNAMVLKRSYKLMLKQARKPTKKLNTFHGLTIADMDSTVMTNDEYELTKSASCRPS